jgi:Na+/phosphate symporter
MKSLKTLALLAGFAAWAHPLTAQDTIEIPPEIMEAIQGDIATIHQDLMQSTIQLDAGQAGPFWSIYDEYLEEMKTLTAERTELIRDFAMAFDTMTDDSARDMGRRALEFDARRQDLVRRYFDRVADEVGGVVAGQFLQIEHRIQTLKDLRLALEIPIIGE